MLLSLASARSSCTAFSENGQYFTLRTVATQNMAAVMIARMRSVLRSFVLFGRRSAARQVPGSTTSTEDMKLGVLLGKKCWKLRQQISRQTLVPFSTDCLFGNMLADILIRMI